MESLWPDTYVSDCKNEKKNRCVTLYQEADNVRIVLKMWVIFTRQVRTSG